MRHRAPQRCALALAVLVPSAATADTALVAVATNFAEAAGRLAGSFETRSGHRLQLSAGSTGKLYAQIIGGAPYDVFLAADRRHPELLVEAGRAVGASRFTYAVGRLTLWSRDAGRVGDGPRALLEGDFRRLAIANPALAPYGAAARETLLALGVLQSLESRLVLGENVAQAYAMVATGNAELGLVALSSVLGPRTARGGSRWDVPETLHGPIRQDAVLLARASGNDAARAFLQFLRHDGAARRLLAGLGYFLE